MRALLLVALASCLPAPGVPCGDRICPPGSVCNEETGTCAVDDPACAGKADGEPCDHVSGEIGYCDRDACYLPRCGDGSVAPATEECEGDAVSVSCADLGYYEGDAVGCTTCRYDVSACSGRCGDGVIQDQFDEACEGTQPPVGSCLDYGFERGHLGCTLCRPGFSACGEIGWIDISTGTAVDLNAVISVGGDLFAIGSDPERNEAAVLRRVGGGWSVMQTWPYPGRQLNLTAIAATSTSDIWVVGYDAPNPNPNLSFTGRIYHFDGAAWTEEMVASRQLDDVWVAPTGEVFVAATTQNLSTEVRRRVSGAWVNSTFTTGAAKGIWGTSASDVYLATDNGAHRWNGATWSPFQAGNITTPLFDVHGFGTDVYFLSAAVQRWNGASLTSLGGPPSVSPFSKLEGSAQVGPVVTSASRVWWYGGTRWVDITGELSLGVGMSGTPRDDQFFVVGADGAAHRYSGSVWRPIAMSLGSPQLGVAQVFAATSGALYAIDALPYGDVWRHNVGGSWQKLAYTAPQVGTTYRRAEVIWGTGNLVVVGTRGVDNTGGPTTSKLHYDGGTLPALTFSQSIFGIAGSGPTDIHVVGDGVAYRYNGNAWSLMTIPTDVQVISTPACRPSGECFAIAETTATIPARLLRTAGNGAPWTVEATSGVVPSEIRAMWASNDELWAVGRNGLVARYTNGAWSVVPSGTAKHLDSVVGLAADDVFIGALNGGALLHYDGVGIERVRPRVGETGVISTALARHGADVVVGGMLQTGGTFVPLLDVLERTTPW